MQGGGSSTCCSHPCRAQAAAAREGKRAAPLAEPVLCCLITQGVIVHPNQCLQLYLSQLKHKTQQARRGEGSQRDRGGRKQQGEISLFSRICLQIFKLD